MSNNERKTCAIMANTAFDDSRTTMCKYCSGAKFAEDEKEPHWECKKFKIRLKENEDKLLLRCDECLNT